MKLLIGVTGLALFMFLVTHIAGNALIFLGADAFNTYSHTLTSNPLIPVIEIGLLLIFLVHVYKTVTMFLANQQARPVKYVMKKSQGTPSRRTFASQTMIVSGLWLLIFVVIHLKTFKYGAELQDGRRRPRSLSTADCEYFRSPFAVVFYLVSMMVVGSHVWHGSASAFQSLGLDSPRWTPRIRAFTKVAAAVIAGGFIVIVLWVHFTQFSGQVGR